MWNLGHSTSRRHVCLSLDIILTHVSTRFLFSYIYIIKTKKTKTLSFWEGGLGTNGYCRPL